MRNALLFSLLAVASSGALAATSPTFAGCDSGSFTSVDGNVHIAIAGRTYSPKCLRVRVGATVVIDASSIHPLQGVGQDNPIFDEMGGAVSAKTVTFTKPGLFGYFCVAHGDDSGAGMAGAIQVE